MKKTIIASAIAATVLSTSAYSMETASELAAMLESMPTVYGNIQYAIVYTDVDGQDSTNSGLADNGSTLGFKHSHQITDDLKGFLKIELDGITADDKTTSRSSSTIQLDEAYIGLEGSSFGRLWIGSDDSIMEQKTQAIANHWEIGILNVGRNGTTGEGDLIQYVSPSMEGFSVFGAIQFKSDNDKDDDGVVIDYESDNPFQLGASYSAGALTINVAMDSNGGVAKGTNDEASYAIRAEYAMNNWSVATEFETRDDDSDRFGLMGKYSMGQTSFALAYEQKTDESPSAVNKGEDFSVVSLQVLQNISGNAYVYAEAYFATAEEDGQSDIDTDQFGIGAVYYF